jgi:N-acetylneuraminic acid mutarotase
VEAYNAVKKKWIRKIDLPVDRSAASAAAIGTKIYVVGGRNLSGVATKTLYVYSVATNTWTQKASLPVKSAQGIAGVIAGKLYLLTSTGEFGATQQLYRYNPTTNTWTRRADPINDHIRGVGGVINGKFYAAWGRSPRSNFAFNASFSVDMYDPTINRWTVKLPATDPGHCSEDSDCSLSGPGSAVLNQQLFVMGGRNDDDFLEGTRAYNPVTNTWTSKAPMPFARDHGLIAGKVKNAAGQLQIIVVGGDNFAADLETANIYTP